MSRAARISRALALPLTLLFTVWGGLVLIYTRPLPEAAAIPSAAVFLLIGLLGIGGLFFARLRPVSWLFVVLSVVLLGWWASLSPSNDRDWQTDVAVLPSADIHGDLVTLHNVRNFEYRSETDYTPHYYDKTVDLRQLDSVDLITSYWMGDAIAHVMLSFGFGPDDHIAVSIETRKEKGESYSSLAGFFRQYELYYVVADERDVIGVRTNYRQDPPEDVYVYRLRGDNAGMRNIFLDYLKSINDLNTRPAWYNTMTTNCTTTIWTHAHVNENRVPFSWKILLSGYVPEFLYERGRLAAGGPGSPEPADGFAELRRRSHINEAARQAPIGPDFSRRIRGSLP